MEFQAEPLAKFNHFVSGKSWQWYVKKVICFHLRLIIYEELMIEGTREMFILCQAITLNLQSIDHQATAGSWKTF